MNEDINYNEVLISGIINVITDTNSKYIKFGLTTNKYTLNEDKKVYVSLNISRGLFNTYQDLFLKGNKVFVKGYLNSYIDQNKKIQSFISVTDISNNPNDITKGRKSPYIRYDPDGVMVWNGKRCESVPPTEKEREEMQNLINSITNERNECNMLEKNTN